MINRMRWVPLLLLLSTLGACDLIGDVLEFGFWVIIILVVIVALLIWGIFKMLS